MAGRKKKTGIDKGKTVLIYLTLKRRAILGRIHPQMSKALYQLIDSFADTLPNAPDALLATISDAQAKAAAQHPQPATEPPRTHFKRLCTRCSRVNYPACSTCRTANGLPP